MRKYLWLLCAATALVSCNGSKVRIKGKFPCSSGKTVYLDVVSPGKQQIVDSAVMNDKGAFKFEVELPNGMPTIYNLRSGNEFIPLLLSKGESVKINALANISRNYTVEGSEGSELMKKINTILTDGAAKLDSLSKAFLAETDETNKQELLKQYSQLYYAIKRDHIKFIVENCSSVASIYGLYQRLPNDETLFNGDGDVVYYRMVADSTGSKYPLSPYVVSLQKLLADYDNRLSMMDLLDKNMNDASAQSYPDIEIADMYGNKKKLSDLSGKVILVDFWAASVPACKLTNAEYKEVYEQNANKGFEIYQVSLDESKPLWVTTVQEQKLPWVTVCDFRGTASSAVRAYNVTSIPANYLINAQGEIVGKNLYGKKLEEKLSQLLK